MSLYSSVANFYIQRIFDIGLNNYVTYTTAIPTVTPVPATTTPVGVGPFNSSTHTILSRYDNPTQDILGGVDVDTPIVPIVGDTIVWSGTSFEPVSGGSGLGIGGFVWAPGFPSGDSGNVYTTWAALYAAVIAAPVGARSVLCVDTWDACEIPSGSWKLRGWCFRGVYTDSGDKQVSIRLLDGASMDSSTDAEVDGGSGRQRIDFYDIRIFCEADAVPFWDVTVSNSALLFTRCGINMDAGASPLIRLNGFSVDVYMYDTYLDSTGGTSAAVSGVAPNSLVRIHMYDDSSVLGDFVTDGGTPGDLEVRYTYDASSTDIVDPSSYAMDATWVTWTPTEPRCISVTGATNVLVAADVGTPEVTVGGLLYSPSDSRHDDKRGTWDQEINFAAMASAPTTSAVVRLYDIGSPGSLTAPVLISEVTVSSTDGAVASTSMAVDGDGIPAFNTVGTGVRLYELRVVADAAEDTYVHWAGIRVGDDGGF